MANTKGTDILSKMNGEEKKKPKTLAGWLNSMKPELERALPRHIKPDRILRIAITAIRTNPKLQSCDPISFIAALMQCAQLGLEPNTPMGEAYLIPRKFKGVMKVQFQFGYKGIMKLAYNTGLYKMIYGHPVYRNDKFSYQLGLHKDLQHIPANRPEGKPVYYYACYHLLTGGYDFAAWSREQIEAHRDQYSPSAKYEDSSWQTSFDAMALKTVLIAALKYAPQSVELVNYLSMDETIKSKVAEDMTEVPSDLDITPTAEDLPADETENGNQKAEKKEKKEESKEDTDTYSVNDNQVSLGDLEEIAKAAGYDNWKAIIIEGCKLKNDKGKPLFSADITESGAKDLLQKDKNRFSVLYEHFNRIIDQQQVKAGKG